MTNKVLDTNIYLEHIKAIVNKQFPEPFNPGSTPVRKEFATNFEAVI